MGGNWMACSSGTWQHRHMRTMMVGEGRLVFAAVPGTYKRSFASHLVMYQLDSDSV
jgi:hypothetical protein